MRQKYAVPAHADDDLVTVPFSSVTASSRRQAAGTAVALVCVAALIMDAAADVIPSDPTIGVLTPLRLVIGAGFVGLLLAGWSPLRSRTPLGPALALLLLAAAVATVLSGQDWSGWRAVLTNVLAFMLVAGLASVLPDAWPALATTALLASAVAGFTAIKQFVEGTPTGFCRAAIDASADVCGPGALVRVDGTFANPNLLAAFLVLMLPIAAAGAARLADRWSRMLGATVIAVGFVAIVLTGSRGGVLAAIAAAVVFAALRWGLTRWMVLVGGAVVVLCGAFFAVGGGSVGVRTDVWGAAVRLLLAHPLGIGPGRAGALIDAAIPGDEAFQHAHDLWLNWAVETGVPGLLAMLAVTVGAGVVATRAARSGSVPAAATGAGLAGFAVISIADNPANALRVGLAMWMVLGLVSVESVRRAAVQRST